MIRRLLVSASIVAVLSWPGLTAQSQSPDSSPVLIGMLRADGVVVPFAQFDRRKWTNDGAGSFDDDIRKLPSAWFVKDGGSPALWTALFSPEARLAGYLTTVAIERREIHGGRAVAVPAGCAKIWGLTSDFPTRLAKRDDAGGLTIGIALTGGRDITDFVSIKPSAAEALRARTFLESSFNRLEDQKIAGDAYRFANYPSAAARRRLPLSIEQMSRTTSGESNGRLYFARVIRKYPDTSRSSTDRCDDFGELNAWISEDAQGRLTMAFGEFRVSDCDGKGDQIMTPIGMFQLDGRAFIAVAEYGYESETHTILELAGGLIRRVLSTDGGGC